MKFAVAAAPSGDACRMIRSCLQPAYRTDEVSTGEELAQLPRRDRYELVFIDMGFVMHDKRGSGDAGYQGLMGRYRQAFPAAEIIVMGEQELIREMVMAVKGGASNYLTYPINPEEVTFITESLHESLRMESELDYHRDRLLGKDFVEFTETHSPIMEEVLSKVRSVARTKTTVFITGETGTGKGVVAKMIHTLSSRRDRQFISVHCGAIPDTLLESELFGHEKGAFTGAIRRKLGRFELASGGTIFLDEIGTITPMMQIKLLQVLQDQTIQRIGGEGMIGVDVRIIIATNEDLEKKCAEGAFRKDLYYRLNVFPIEIPPLRDRAEDIPVFIDSFLRRLNATYGKTITGVDPLVISGFDQYRWPGNIREMENIVERAYILESSPVLTPRHFPADIFTGPGRVARVPIDTSVTLSDVRERSLGFVESQYLRELLQRNRGSIKNTASEAGVGVRQLHKLMKKHGIKKEEYRPSGTSRDRKPEQ